jgi:hypothetical protein
VPILVARGSDQQRCRLKTATTNGSEALMHGLCVRSAAELEDVSGLLAGASSGGLV